MKMHLSFPALLLSVVLWSMTSVAQGQTSKDAAAKSSSNQEALLEIARKFRVHYTEARQKAVAKAMEKNWPVFFTDKKGREAEIQEFGPDGSPLYYITYNDNVLEAARVLPLQQSQVYGLGVDGSGMQVGIWDSGRVRPDHQEFAGRTAAGDQNDRISGHATHVAGTLLASGVNARAKGVAYNATGLSFDWTLDEAEVAEAAAAGMLVSNHSYGLSGRSIPDWYFGAYIYQSRDWDEIMYNAPYYLMVTAAGNTRQAGYNQSPNTGNPQDGYDQLLGFATSKNGLTVAASQNPELLSDGSVKADIASFSNFGPTDDGRIKPDITGAGVGVYSSFGDNSTSYNTMSGTSMASPGVTGALLLLQQYHHTAYGSYMKSATLKGLVLHTADDAGLTGPDPQFGWGIINATRAAEHIASRELTTDLREEMLQQGAIYSTQVEAQSGQTLKVSLSYTDLPFTTLYNGKMNPTASVLVNDLDLRIYKDGKEYLPWKLLISKMASGAVKGDNTADPYEQIEIPAAAGVYTITVSHKGTLSGGSQAFSLLISGARFSECAPEIPGAVQLKESGESSLTLGWEGSTSNLYEVSYRQQGEESWQTEYADTNTVSLQSLAPKTTYEVQVRTVCNSLISSASTQTQVFTTAEPPLMAPTGLQVDYLGSGSIQLHWGVVSSKNAPLQYRVYRNGALLGMTGDTQLRIDGLVSSKLYELTVDVVDGKGNVSKLSDPLYYRLPIIDSQSRQLFHLDMEAGVSPWQSVGYWTEVSDLYTYDGTTSISNNQNGESKLYSPLFDASEFDAISVEFDLLSRVSSRSEQILLQMNSGKGWVTVRALSPMEELKNNYFYHISFQMSAQSFTLADGLQLRLVAVINSQDSFINIDNVNVTGYKNLGLKRAEITPLRAFENTREHLAQEYDQLRVLQDYQGQSISFFGMKGAIGKYRITDINGRSVSNGVASLERIDVSDLPPGVYLVSVMDSGARKTLKFLKR